jgi:cellulose synthase/poly-beta-1,6-N-acetylglucosamine synthase-like glycosyltransferase
MKRVFEVLFWSSMGLGFYTLVLYPALLIALAGFAQLRSDLRFAWRRPERRRQPEETLPTVSLIICAHNEEQVIAERMKNCAQLNYPTTHLEILVGCDGCTDGTIQRASQAASSNTVLFDYLDRAGKSATLTRLVPKAQGEILVFSDANTMLDANALSHLVKHFADPRVGCVCGELKLATPEGRPVTEGHYWRFECFLKFLESRLEALVSANGAIYAIRRSLFRPLPPGTINDDLLISMNVLQQGYRIVYDPQAVAYEETASLQQEFRRRVRIGSGDFRALRHSKRLLNPFSGRVAAAYWSHKILRWVLPFTITAALISSIALSHDAFYAAAAGLGFAMVAAAGVGYALESRHVRSGILRFPCYFLLMNLALLVGFLRDIFGRRTVLWTPTPRVQTAAAQASGRAAQANADARRLRMDAAKGA